MVTARLAVGSVSTLALGALLFGSAPYWLNRGNSHGTPWGAISSLSIADPAAAQSDAERAQLLKLAALKTATPADQPALAPAKVDPAPAPQPVAQMDAAPAAVPAPAAAVPAPAVPEAAPPVQTASVVEPAAPEAVPADDGNAAKSVALVNINTASSNALDRLPGAGRIGHAIVSHRPYKSVKDLVNKRVLRMSDFQKIQAHISVD